MKFNDLLKLRLSEELRRKADEAAQHRGFSGVSAYVRHLIERDIRATNPSSTSTPLMASQREAA